MSFKAKTPQELEISDLLKQATVQAKDKDYDAAIAGLLRAYSLMKTVQTEWGIKPYFRVARYHHLAGRYEDALNWLQELYANVDASFDAREKLYKEWGWMQKKGVPLKIPTLVRNNYRKVINKEIDLLMTRQQKIEQRLRKSHSK